MTVKLTQQDLEIFQIPGFKERMEALRGRLRPKLEHLGEEIGPLLMNQFKKEFFAHTAKHMRRTVNPPDETWVALGPQSRGYKAYVHFACVVGRCGVQARVVMKDESEMRKTLGENLLANLNFFGKHLGDFSGLSDYTRRDKNYRPQPIENIIEFIEEAAPRLIKLKSAHFDVGFELKPTAAVLEQALLKAFERMYPFYECGLQKGLRFK